MQGKVLQANATRKNLGESGCCSQSHCITNTGQQQVSDGADEQDALTAQHYVYTGKYISKNTGDWVKLSLMNNKLQQALPAFKCQSRQNFLLLANTGEIHLL